MEIYNRVLKHPLSHVVTQGKGAWGNGFSVNVPEANFTCSVEGISKDLTAASSSNWDYSKAAQGTAKSVADKKRRAAAKAAATGWPAGSGFPPSVGPMPADLRTPRSAYSYRPSPYRRKFEGLERGTAIHKQIEVFAKVSSGSDVTTSKGLANAISITEKVLSENGKTGALLDYTKAIIASLPLWKLRLVEAEWCVADLKPVYDKKRNVSTVQVGKYATKIDIIAVHEDEHQEAKVPDDDGGGGGQFKPRLVLCETKTGYNGGVFVQATGKMLEPFSALSNSPCNQAKLQLVFGAAMFVQSYGLKWSDVELNVIHCPTVKGERLFKYKVSRSEIKTCIAALKAANFLI